MDEKTAPIPSLKDWEDRRAQRSAHVERTGSMQTKGQMKRSADRQQAATNRKTHSANRPASSGANGSALRRNPSGNAKPGSNAKPRTAQADSQRRPAQTTSQRRPAQTTSQRRPASAPAEYARQRNAANSSAPRGADRNRSDYDSSRRVERTPQNRQNAEFNRRQQSGRPAGSTQNRRPRGNSTTPCRSSERRNVQRGTGSGATPPRKPPRKPLSPAARKFRSICVSVLVVFIVLVIGAILSLTVLFKTEEINVKGSGAYSKEDIIEASGLILGDNIFTSPKSRAEDKIEKKFPYVEKAEVYSVFPNGINIDITLAEPAYGIEALGGFYIVSDKGKVLEVAASDDEARIPVIEGVEIEGKPAGDFVEYESELVGTALTQLFEAFEQTGSERITAINISDSGDTFSMKYVYDNRIVVYIGLPEHIDYKVQTACTIIKEKIDVGGSMIAGDLDVSLCYDTMKSYFNEYTLLSPHVSATIPEETEPEQAETQVYYY